MDAEFSNRNEKRCKSAKKEEEKKISKIRNDIDLLKLKRKDKSEKQKLSKKIKGK